MSENQNTDDHTSDTNNSTPTDTPEQTTAEQTTPEQTTAEQTTPDLMMQNLLFNSIMNSIMSNLINEDVNFGGQFFVINNPENTSQHIFSSNPLNEDEEEGDEEGDEEEGENEDEEEGEGEDEEGEGENEDEVNPQNELTHNSLLSQLVGQHGQFIIPLGNMSAFSGLEGIMTLLGTGSIDYFANANDEFKALIGENETAKALYNCCCKIILGPYEDFIGRFTDNFLCKAHSIINEFYHNIIGRLYEDEADFFDEIFVPIINILHQDYKNKRDQEARQKLENCIHEFKEGDKFENDCCICICEIDDKYAKLPCGHVMHYECVRQWFMEQLVCPVCRYSFENGKIADKNSEAS